MSVKDTKDIKLNKDSKDSKDAKCPVPYASWFSFTKKDDKDSKDEKKTSTRKFPWKAFGGLSLVAISFLLSLFVAIALVLNYYYYVFHISIFPFKILYFVLSTVVKVILWPIVFIFSLLRSSPAPGPVGPVVPVPPVSCINTLEVQGWEILTLVPGPDGNPASAKYSLNAPTSHALSILDIDYRDTRIDVLSNGKYYGSTSDVPLNKTAYCGAEINECLRQGFSTGTIIIPPGKQEVELAWSGKDVFPGTDKIVWGGDRTRRVLWKKELCL